ncbi:MAG: hypothetical protein MUC29_14535 [Pyrinomonadaceae bacterium]|jgi:hypothetical protein|nr:hypothetical protein [Pyrinomonadaceae bacterium]
MGKFYVLEGLNLMKEAICKEKKELSIFKNHLISQTLPRAEAKDEFIDFLQEIVCLKYQVLQDLEQSDVVLSRMLSLIENCENEQLTFRDILRLGYFQIQQKSSTRNLKNITYKLQNLQKEIEAYSKETFLEKLDKDVKLLLPNRYKCLKLTKILFSPKTQKDTFEPIMADWDEEIYEALKENKDASLFMINVRNTYGFIMAMILKSPIGELFEFVQKLRKG